MIGQSHGKNKATAPTHSTKVLAWEAVAYKVDHCRVQKSSCEHLHHQSNVLDGFDAHQTACKHHDNKKRENCSLRSLWCLRLLLKCLFSLNFVRCSLQTHRLRAKANNPWLARCSRDEAVCTFRVNFCLDPRVKAAGEKG